VNVFTLDSNEHYFRSRNLALPQDSHSLRVSTRDLWTVVYNELSYGTLMYSCIFLEKSGVTFHVFSSEFQVFIVTHYNIFTLIRLIKNAEYQHQGADDGGSTHL
jgi:hypothetical protein